ncbi:NAD dependent epimerase/dehydratase [Thecamonas trahens ATCC 50062]|uniref:NAD dependent epimerase/dehydratase n=1 Tax=Thecamonas trahens ATCC 50062 TaxID=461836 RepID=A0A0L0DTN5_THETB|nr:NAD dependent epimerase/dehydratase [Thecamonas trahens ATCC 50062]KNC55605.1 NAD dependent epimerase/dehydratase [Thecamonas trahens ATCC 50062]|eukprot:XP_013761378.1 NAD dependent epimerase/dehydratase [Thecamonas trahens ATCC 50062]
MADEYKPKAVLLTGGAGFIGSNVLIHLVEKYPEVRWVNYDSLEYCACLKNLESIESADNYKFIKGNILNAELVTYVLESENIDTIMHFAAQSHVDNSFGNSIQFTVTNVHGTHVLLESAKAYGKIRRFVHVSTDEVYGECEGDHLDEDSILRPTQPYAAAKAGAEHLVMAYYKSYNLPIIITRGNNVYGPRQFPEKVIPKFVNLIMRGRKCCLHGDGSAQRSFLHVQDVAAAFDVILHRGAIGEVYNIGTTFELSMLELTKVLYKVMGREFTDDAVEFVEDRKFNDSRYAISSARLEALGWAPSIEFEAGLKATIEWYDGNWGDIEDALVPHPRLVTDLSNRTSYLVEPCAFAVAIDDN